MGTQVGEGVLMTTARRVQRWLGWLFLLIIAIIALITFSS